MIFCYACGSGSDSVSDNDTPVKVSGVVQKGPFLNGTAVTIYELDENLNPSGRTYNVQTNTIGAFESPNIVLASNYVGLKADGYYFNEVTGVVSAAPITLYALVDLTDKSTVNVNIMTHLERERVKVLVAKGSTFADAKKQAQKEIFQIFEINTDDAAASETLDLSRYGSNNDVLLAISAVLQGNRTEAELSELLANIVSDLKENGTLTNAANGSALINSAKYLDAVKVESNLDNRYKTLGVSATIPDIVNIINNFISKTTFQLTEYITYPANGTYGLNLLDKNNTVYPVYDYSTGPYISLAAVLPEGHTLKVKISGVGKDNWYYSPLDGTGWQWGDYDYFTHSRTFTSTQTGSLDLKLIFTGGQVTVDVWENGSDSPTWTKTITAN